MRCCTIQTAVTGPYSISWLLPSAHRVRPTDAVGSRGTSRLTSQEKTVNQPAARVVRVRGERGLKSLITHKYTLICDDVRQENTGKLLLIGVYTGTLTTPQLPFVMPNGLTFFSSWESDRPGIFDMKIKLQHLETGQTLIEARGGMQFVQPGLAMAPLKLGPLQFSAVGMYNLVIEIGGQSDPVIVGFSVQLNIAQPPHLQGTR
jgi:hypothetical protein